MSAKKVYVVSDHGTPAVFVKIESARAFVARMISQTYRSYGYKVRIVVRGKMWNVDFNDGSEMCVALDECGVN